MALLGIGDETPTNRVTEEQSEEQSRRKPGQDPYKDIVAASAFLQERISPGQPTAMSLNGTGTAMSCTMRGTTGLSTRSTSTSGGNVTSLAGSPSR